MRNLMKQVERILSTIALLIATCAILPAQSGSFHDVRINQTVEGGTFNVDGVPYTSSQVFRWQVGDVHTVSFRATQAIDVGGTASNATRIRFFGTFEPIYDSQAISQPPTGLFQTSSRVVGSDTLFEIRIQMWSFFRGLTLNNTREHRLRFVTPGAGCAPTMSVPLLGACGDVPGYTHVESGTCDFLATTGDYWCGEGRTEFTSVPGVGYAFKDWNSNPGIPNPTSTGIASSVIFNLVSPVSIQVNFGPGKFYAVATDPPGLEVAIDRSIYRPTGTDELCNAYQEILDTNGFTHNVGQGGGRASAYCFVWLFGSTRLLAAPELQTDRTGRRVVFDSWSNGGGQNHLFEVSGANLSTDVLTARFLPAGGVTFVTQPQLNLPLVVNNRTWPSYNFWFGINKDVTFSAPLETVDQNGRRWRFRSWSNGGAAAQTLRISQEIVDRGLYLVATYEPLNRVTIDTNPSGLTINVDGNECRTPCLVEKAAAESINISPVRTVNQADYLRLEFANWSDGGAADRQVGFQAEASRIVANYRPLFRLNTVANPSEGAVFTLLPESPDNFYAADARVTITARALPGFRFRRWSGDTAGLFNTASVTMSGPRAVVAELETVPFLDPAGIRNSAGTGPQDQGTPAKVAPGSLLTITGSTLTDRDEVGPRTPLAQTLAGLSVRVGTRLLPLSFAAPHQINAQLPYDIPLGRQTMTVVRTGQADVSAEFEVVRNAPGLFSQPDTGAEGQPPVAYAFRADGSTIAADQTAAPNEIVNFVATGLGPYRNNPPAGFAIPAGNEFALADPVEVLVNDQTVQPLRVIAAPGFVGMTFVQVRIGSQFPSGQASTVRVRVNGKESNAVRLQVR
jgi:uncharacterized protein (TIGR03437 family)